MSNLDKSESNFVHLIPNELGKRSNFHENYYFLVELLIIEYR